MSKIILHGHIIVPDADLEAVKTELVIHKNLTLNEIGCLTFDVLQDENNINKFNVFEEFCDQQSFDNHQKRVKNSRWGKVTINVKRYYQISKN